MFCQQQGKISDNSVSPTLIKDAWEDLGLLKKLKVNAMNLSLELKNTSINKVEKSPTQLLMSCHLRTLLLTLNCLLYSHTENPSIYSLAKTC